MGWRDAATPITAMGQAAAATLAFRVGGELRVAAVVKASFVLASDGPMVLTDPEPILGADEHRDESPTSSLVAAADLVPYRPRADVLLSGHARAPLERPTPAMAVRLMIARGRDIVLDKRLAVRGTPDPSSRTREPAPFSAMRFAWELAAATPDNPVGISEGPGAWPHIVDPRHRDRAAGFGPISPRWPERKRLFPAAADLLAARIPELPRDFAWAYFNAAPEDQRLDFLRGDEWVGFEGMNSQLPRVQSCLPGVRARANVYGPSPELQAGRPIPLEADTLTLDADRLRCSVVWRGSFPVAREQDLGALHVVAGVETAEAPLSLPASYPVRAAHTPSPPPPPSPSDASRTGEMPAFSALPPAATPFELHDPAPHGTTPAPVPEQAATTMLNVADLLRHAPALPFAPTAAPALPFAPTAAPSPRTEPRGPLPAATPFEKPRPAPSSRVRADPITAEIVPITMGGDPPYPPARPVTSPPTHPDPPARTVAFNPNATVDFRARASSAPALPFAPTATPLPERDPQQPLPVATPFEQFRRTPPPSPSSFNANAMVDLPGLLPTPEPLTVGQQAVRSTAADHDGGYAPKHPLEADPGASPPGLALATPIAEPSDGEPAEPPRTLGGFFLAAMARAARSQAHLSGGV